ncbi:MAG: hypothetical protein QE263_08355 [Vampirovibrionales bacterium]|nr:hypothetical protein [Vampirovibrionales bacterium]
MSMNIGTTRFAAAVPVAEVDFSAQLRTQQKMAHEAMMARFGHEAAMLNNKAHLEAVNTSHKLNRLA